MATTPYVALTGNPNCGKTTLFNALTGLRAKVGNYAGVTVERKEGRLQHTPADLPVTLLDLPGTYSLSPQSLDEQVARDILFHRLKDVPAPTLVVVVIDASNLQRNLYYATQVIELGYPTIVALNMLDVAKENGLETDAAQLSAALGVPVIPLVASTGRGVKELREKIVAGVRENRRALPKDFCELPEAFGQEATALAALLEKTFHERKTEARAEALLILSDERALTSSGEHHYPATVTETIQASRRKLEAAGVDWRSAAIEARYARASAIQMAVTKEVNVVTETFSDRVDQVVTHRIWGFVVFIAIMGLMFSSIYWLAEYPMGWIEAGQGWISDLVQNSMAEGPLRSLLVDGVIAGVGGVVIFLPQIILLFLFISILEDTGYMARAAFLMDRLMSKVGLHGKSFIPMLSSYACAIPGIMAARTIESPKDRLVTILVAPLMSCSARLPVYSLLIGACIPNLTVLGFLKLPGLVLLAMYLLGTVMALLMAWLFKKTLLRGTPPMMIMELPPYKRPGFFVTLRHMWDRSKLFLTRAGTVILGISILIWFLSSYPKSDAVEKAFAEKRAAITAAQELAPETEKATFDEQLQALDNEENGEHLRYSFAGRMGHAIEPAIAPLGFDWKIGIGIITSFAAREVFVSTMSTVYNLGGSDEDTQSLEKLMQDEKRPDGSKLYTPLLAITLMVFYVLAMQCVSTNAVVLRETRSWKWTIFQWCYMGALAWIMSFLTYHGGKLLGFQ